MSDLKWLAGYSGQSTDELIGLQGEYRSDSLVVAFEEALDQKCGRCGLDGLTDEERVVLAVEALEREVNNGGYDQFFTNTSGAFAPFVVDALMRIGCPRVAALTEEAIGALSITGAVTVEAIEAATEEDSDERDRRLEECDGKYYEIAGDLSSPLLKFIEANRDNIKLCD